MASKALQRIQKIFQRGELVILGEGDDRVFLWVAKLNAMEKEEANLDGRSARAMRMLAFDRSEEEQASLQILLERTDDREIMEALLNRKAPELYMQAEDEIRSEDAWKERLEAIDRASLLADRPASEEEKSLAVDLLLEYQREIEKRHRKALQAERRSFNDMDRAELEDAYRKQWREMLGATAFHEARRQTELWLSLRECTVDVDADGPVMSTLVVGERLLDERADVLSLPDEVIAQVVAAFEREMSARDAGNSDAPAASSVSSVQRSVEEDSKPSTPTEM